MYQCVQVAAVPYAMMAAAAAAAQQPPPAYLPHPHPAVSIILCLHTRPQYTTAKLDVTTAPKLSVTVKVVISPCGHQRKYCQS